MKKILDAIICVNWIIIFLGLFYLLFLQFYPFKILDIEGQMGVSPSVVKSGESIIITRRIEKLVDMTAQVSCKFEDGVMFTVPARLSTNIMGQISEDIVVSIPNSLPEGKYSYICDLVFQVSPFRTINYTWQTETFEVIK